MSGISLRLSLHLLILVFIFFLNFISRIIMAPLLPQVMEDLAMSASQASGLFFIMSAGYFVSLLGSAFAAAWFKHRGTIIISCLLLGLSMFLVSMSDSAALLKGAMLILGLGAGLYLPSGISTITSMFPAGQWGRALSVHELAPNMAFILAPVTASMFLAPFGWQRLCLLMAGAAIMLAGLFYLMGAGDFRASRPRLSAYRGYLGRLEFWIMMLLFGLGVMSTLGIYNILPLYLVTMHNFSKADANTLISLSRISTLATALLGGVISDKIGPRRTIFRVLLFTGCITIMLGFVSGTALKACVFLQPLLAVAFFPAAFAAMSAISAKEDRGMVVSILVSAAFLEGAGGVPALIGLLADHGLFKQGFMGAGAALCAGAGLAFFLPQARRRAESSN